MPTKKPASLKTELAAFLKKYPKTASMELLVPDMLGILKGKRIRRSDFGKVAKDGFFFCAGAVMLDALGKTIPGMPYTEHDGDPDLPAELVHGSFAPIPWADKPTAQALFRILDEHLWFAERAGEDWIVPGAHPTIADIACFPYVILSEEGGVSRQDYPAIRRWTDRFKRIPASP